MPDQVVLTGDIVNFLPPFGKALITPIPGVMVGSGKVTHMGRKICLEGDEGNVIVPGVPYISPPFVIPGVGMLTISALGSDQLTKKTTDQGTKVILKGSKFDAEFQVLVPAMQPPPASVPDATPKYQGNGMFITSNFKHWNT